MLKALCLGSFCYISLDYTQINPGEGVPQKSGLLSFPVFPFPQVPNYTDPSSHHSFQDVFGYDILVN